MDSNKKKLQNGTAKMCPLTKNDLVNVNKTKSVKLKGENSVKLKKK